MLLLHDINSIINSITIFACCNTSSGSQVKFGGSISDFGCSYSSCRAFSPDSFENLLSFQKYRAPILEVHTKGNAPKSKIIPCLSPKAVKNPLPKRIFSTNELLQKSSSRTIDLCCKSYNNDYSGNRKLRKYSHGENRWNRRNSSSAYSDVIRPTSDLGFICRNNGSKLIRPPVSSGTLDPSTSSCDHSRRKLFSVSKRNSRYKVSNDENWSSDDTDNSSGTSRFGNYLSNLSACPSLDNCASRTNIRKCKKNLPKESKSSREKCYDFLRSNFCYSTLHSKSISTTEKECNRNHFNSSSSDRTNSELEIKDFEYSDDSLDGRKRNKTVKSVQTSGIRHDNIHTFRDADNAISTWGRMTKLARLNEEVEILRRQLFVKNLELEESLQDSGKLYPSFNQYKLAQPSSTHFLKYPVLTSVLNDVTATKKHSYNEGQTSPSLQSIQSCKSSIPFNSDHKAHQTIPFQKCCTPSLFPSPEPQILSDNHSELTLNSNLTLGVQRRNAKRGMGTCSSYSVNSPNRPSLDNCGCSINMMSRPVQSFLKYFHPAKNSSPHSAFSNSRSSLRSESSIYGQKTPPRLSLTSQFWSKKQINRDRGIVYNGFWNTRKSNGNSNRFSNSRISISTRESNPGVTPFGCTGFFIPARKMKPKRRQSDPFVQNCSRKTLDIVRSMHLPVSPGSQIPYQHLSRIMKLDNELKIIPERLTISSKRYMSK